MHVVHRADDLGERRADVLGADDHGPRIVQRLAAPRRQVVVAAHRVLEL